MKIEENVSLAQFTTLKIGGPARYFCRVESEEDLLEAVRFARERELPLFVLGGGSNLVVRDSGFSGLVVQVGIEGKVVSGPANGNTMRIQFQAPAGVDWDTFVAIACEAGYAGMECLAGIPGTVGGSPVQNIGAYGQEVSQTIHTVRAFDLQAHDFIDLTAKECEFGYRRSIFNTKERGRFIVTRVAFEFDLVAPVKLDYEDLKRHFADKPNPKPMEVYGAVREIRDRKGMVIDSENPGPDSRSAGSFFKNPVVSARVFKDILDTLPPDADTVPHWPTDDGRVKLAAAWLIEHSGFKKGYALGRVGISSKHTLALVNRSGDATCEELLRLRDLIVLTVEQRFGVTLVMEPVMLG